MVIMQSKSLVMIFPPLPHFILCLVIEGKGLMSKEPGVCDSYVKVYDEQDVGVGMNGVGVGEDHTEFEGPSISVQQGHSAWQLQFHHLVSRHLLG